MGAKLCKSNDKKYLVDDSLEKYDNKCPMFTLEGQEHQAKVVNIYDGDTIKVVFKIFDELSTIISSIASEIFEFIKALSCISVTVSLILTCKD